MAGTHVTLLSSSAPQGLILTDTDPGLLGKEGERGSQRCKSNVGGHFLSSSSCALHPRPSAFKPESSDTPSVTLSHS